MTRGRETVWAVGQRKKEFSHEKKYFLNSAWRTNWERFRKRKKKERKKERKERREGKMEGKKEGKEKGKRFCWAMADDGDGVEEKKERSRLWNEKKKEKILTFPKKVVFFYERLPTRGVLWRSCWLKVKGVFFLLAGESSSWEGKGFSGMIVSFSEETMKNSSQSRNTCMFVWLVFFFSPFLLFSFRLPSWIINLFLIMTLRLLIAAGKASPAAPVGPALGQRGLNIMDFCKQVFFHFHFSSSSSSPANSSFTPSHVFSFLQKKKIFNLF